MSSRLLREVDSEGRFTHVYTVVPSPLWSFIGNCILICSIFGLDDPGFKGKNLIFHIDFFNLKNI